MKILLTGASGILGSDINAVLTAENHEVKPFNSTNIELGNFSDVRNKVLDFKPELVVHCAAMTNVDLCETDRQQAVTTNVVGTQNLAIAAAKINAKIIYISSCGVYGNGKSTAYNELDNLAPTTYHHFTKLKGEEKVREHNQNHIIVRPGWLFGGTVNHKKNFVEARRKEALNAEVLKSAGDKVGSPTYTADLAKQLLKLINQDLAGTFNIVNEGCASRFDYVAEIVKNFGFETKVEPVDSNLFPRKANMPDNECLENMFLNIHNINIMRSWREALNHYIINTYN